MYIQNIYKEILFAYSATTVIEKIFVETSLLLGKFSSDAHAVFNSFRLGKFLLYLILSVWTRSRFWNITGGVYFAVRGIVGEQPAHGSAPPPPLPSGRVRPPEPTKIMGNIIQCLSLGKQFVPSKASLNRC